MKIEELKKIIKPIIKECIKEVLLEEGLSKIIAESMKPSAILPEVDEAAEARFEQVLAQKRAATQMPPRPLPPKQQPKPQLQETKKKMLDAIGNSGFDAFAGTEPLREQAEIKGADPGVDISSLMGNKQIWKQTLDIMNGKKTK